MNGPTLPEAIPTSRAIQNGAECIILLVPFASMPFVGIVAIIAAVTVQNRERLGSQGFDRRSLADDVRVEAQHLLRVAVDHAEVVRNEKDRGPALALNPVNERVDVIFEAGIDTRGRL